MNLWYVFCISVELHLLGFYELIMSQASVIITDIEMKKLWSCLDLTSGWLISQSSLGPLCQNSVVSISSFRAKLVHFSSSAVSARTTYSHDASCAVSGIKNKERMQIILCQNREGKELKDRKQCYNQGQHPPSQYCPASWHVSSSLPSALKEHSSILNSAVFPVSPLNDPRVNVGKK